VKFSLEFSDKLSFLPKAVKVASKSSSSEKSTFASAVTVFLSNSFSFAGLQDTIKKVTYHFAG